MRSFSPENIFVVSTKKRPEKAPELRAFLNAVKLISSHSCGQLFFQINTLVISFPPFNFVFNSELNGDHGYLEILRKFTTERAELIAPLEQPYVRPQRGKIAAAWRCISGEEYLVMEESVWAAWYAKAVKADNTIDAAFLQKPRWELELQKVLGTTGVIKMPNTGYRYRYDLLANGTRDTTYVVATPARLMQETGQEAGQNASPSAKPIAGALAGNNAKNTNDLREKGGE